MINSKNNNLDDIKQHWEKEDTVSLKDKNLQILEREQILNYLRRVEPSIIADIGCGPGEDTLYFSEYCEQIFAYDYSSSMLKKAKKNLEGIKNVTLNELNIIQNNIESKFDAVITKRMLINLGSFENQIKAIKKIHNSLNENGYFIMLETSKDGLNNLNILRQKVGLEDIPEPFHNTLFDLDILKKELSEFFIIEDVSNFSTYFFLTRVYNQLLIDNDNDFIKFDSFAKKTANSIDLFKSEIVGAQFCLLLRKK